MIFVLLLHRMAQRNPGTSWEPTTGEAHLIFCCWTEALSHHVVVIYKKGGLVFRSGHRFFNPNNMFLNCQNPLWNQQIRMNCVMWVLKSGVFAHYLVPNVLAIVPVTLLLDWLFFPPGICIVFLLTICYLLFYLAVSDFTGGTVREISHICVKPWLLLPWGKSWII